MAQPTFITGAAGALAASKAKMIFRSQITPDLEIDVSQALQPSYEPPRPPGLISSFMAEFVRPEVEINAPGFGFNQVVPLYGPTKRPTKNYAPLFLLGLAVAGGLAAAGGYKLLTSRC